MYQITAMNGNLDLGTQKLVGNGGTKGIEVLSSGLVNLEKRIVLGNTNTQETRYIPAGITTNAWRTISTINGAVDGKFVIQHTNDNFSANFVDALVLSNTGDVAIGKANLSSELDVSGTIRADQICDEAGANCKDISTGWGSGGTVTSVVGGTGLTGGTITGTGTLAVDVGTTNGKVAQVGAGDRLPASIIPSITSAMITNGTVANIDLAAGIDASKITTGTLPVAQVPTLSQVKITNLVPDLAAKLPRAGGSMTGAISMGTNKVTNLAPGTVSTDAATKGQMETYVDASTADMKTKTAGTYDRNTDSLEALSEGLSANNTVITSVQSNISTLSTDVGNLSAATGALPWNVTTADSTLSVNNAYAVSSAVKLNLTLPLVCNAGQ